MANRLVHFDVDGKAACGARFFYDPVNMSTAVAMVNCGRCERSNEYIRFANQGKSFPWHRIDQTDITRIFNAVLLATRDARGSIENISVEDVMATLRRGDA